MSLLALPGCCAIAVVCSLNPATNDTNPTNPDFWTGQQVRLWIDQLERKNAIAAFVKTDETTVATEETEEIDEPADNSVPDATPSNVGSDDAASPTTDEATATEETPKQEYSLSYLSDGLRSCASWFEPYKLSAETQFHYALTTWQRMVNEANLPARLSSVSKAVAPVADIAATAANEKEIRLPANIVYVRISKPFLDRYFCRQVDRTTPVHDHILGSNVVGKAHTIGETKLTLHPSDKQAQAELLLVGSNHFESVGHQDPVQISSKGVTEFESRKVIQIDGNGVQKEELPTTVAHTRTKTTGITSSLPGLRGRIAVQVATRKEAESHAEAERITAEHTRERITEEFNAWVHEEMKNFVSNFKKQLGRIEGLRYGEDFAVEEVRCSTTPETLQIVLFARCAGEPYLVEEPPRNPDQPEIEVQLYTGLMKKAFVDPVFRDTLQSAIEEITARKAIQLMKSSRHRDNPPELDVKWTEDLNWMTLSWHIKPDIKRVTKLNGSSAPKPPARKGR